MLFARFFCISHVKTYIRSALPGNKRGVSGSVVIQNNFAINKYINENRKHAVTKFIEFVASKKVQKIIIILHSLPTALSELYSDTEVYKKIECQIIQDPFSFMSNIIKFLADNNIM